MASDEEKLDEELERDQSLVDLEQAIGDRDRALSDEKQRIEAERQRSIDRQRKDEPPDE